MEHTTPADSERLPVEGLNSAVHRRQQRRGRIILESHIWRPGDKISRHRRASLEVLDGDALGVERGRLVVRKGARMLSQGRAPVGLRWLLDGSPIPLAVSADAKQDAIAVEGGFVRKGPGSRAGSRRSRVGGPPRVGWELEDNRV
jgi:hypothetical protein